MYTILYVDDEKSLLDLCKIFLEKSGEYKVDISDSALGILDKIQPGQYDAIVSDYDMPGKNGIEFLIEVRSTFGDIPFILFTGKGREDVVIDAINNGVDFYIQKGGSPRPQFAELSHKIKKSIERKRMLIALHENEERLRFALEGANDGLWDVRIPSGEIFISPRGCEILGYSFEDFSGLKRLWKDLILLHDMPATQAAFLEYRKGNSDIFSVEHRLIMKSGESKWILTRGKVVKWDENGNPIRMTGTISDIHIRKKAESKLQAAYEQIAANEEEMRSQFEEQKIISEKIRLSEDRFKGLTNLLPVPVFETDLTGKLLFTNQTGFQMFEYFMDDFVDGINVLDLVVPEERDTTKNHISLMMQGLLSQKGREYTLQRKNGSRFTAVIYSNRIMDPYSGLIKGFRGVVIDITERKRIEDSLKKSREKLNILSSITRHDILNQIQALNAFCDLIEVNIESDSVSAQYLAYLRQCSEKISQHISFTREYQYLGDNPPIWQNIGTIAIIAAADFLPDTIVLTIEADDIEIFADPMLMLVFYNLFDNAIRYGEKITSITIRFSEDKNIGTLIVEDNGIGISADMKEDIFEKGVGQNTGLGLFFAREVLAITGLSIRETGTQGQGARFEITAPPGLWRNASEKSIDPENIQAGG